MEFDITVARLGFVRIDAKDKNDAARIVNETVKYDDVDWDDDWNITDIQEAQRYEKYLMTFMCEDEPVVKIASMDEVANEICYADCSGADRFKVYGFKKNSNTGFVSFDELYIHHYGTRVWLNDAYGKRIDSFDCNEH